MEIRIDGQFDLKRFGIEAPKQSKYHNQKIEVGGITFDSKKEANRYAELKLMKKAHIILDFELQPEFILQDGYVRNSKNVQPIKYRADFKVTYADGRVVIIDVKSSEKFKTDVYKLKKKILLYKYPDIIFKEEY